jgi:DNA-binding transcriptional ArsR family regulator
MAKQAPREEPSLPEGTQTVTDLAQIRALADPLRLRILGALAGPPRTTKQVAQLLGEKPTKLYHHVAALERVGLVRLKETRPVRGAVEKYYQAVAARFQASSSALAPEACRGEERSELRAMLESILDTARAELLGNLRPAGTPRPEAEEAPLVARVLIRGSHKDIRAARRRVLRWVESLRSAEARGTPPKEGDLTYALTVLFCRADAARG